MDDAQPANMPELAELQPRPPRPRRDWRPLLLTLAVLLALAAGGLYLWQWLKGLRGVELLGFTSKFVCLPLGVSLILLFQALQKRK